VKYTLSFSTANERRKEEKRGEKRKERGK